MVLDTYQRMRAKGTSWAGTRLILPLVPPLICYSGDIIYDVTVVSYLSV